MNGRKIVLSSLFGCLWLASQARADIPILPASYLIGFNILSTVRTAGFAFMAVFLIEALILRWHEQVGFWEAIKLSLMANLFSTAIGAAAFVTFQGFCVNLCLFGGWAVLFAVLVNYLRSKTGFLGSLKLKTQTQTVLFAILFGILFFAVPILGILTIPGHDVFRASRHWQQVGFSSAKEMYTAIISAVLLLGIGFIMTVISEASVIAKYISRKCTEVVATSFYMNLVSYILIILTSVFYIWRVILERSWFYHH